MRRNPNMIDTIRTEIVRAIRPAAGKRARRPRHKIETTR